jgi:hypothetical protein
MGSWKPLSERIELPESLQSSERPSFVDVRLEWSEPAYNQVKPILASPIADDPKWPGLADMLEEVFTSPPCDDRDTLAPLLATDPELATWLVATARDILNRSARKMSRPVIMLQ